jgi:hypothetical protein
MMYEKSQATYPESEPCGVCKKQLIRGQSYDRYKSNDNKWYLLHIGCHPDKPYFDASTRGVPSVTSYVYQFNEIANKSVISGTVERSGDLLLGVHAIMDILRRRPKSITVAGMDFYHGMSKLKHKLNLSEIKIEPTMIYSKHYPVFTNELTAVHKDAEGRQLQLFIYILNHYKEVFPSTTIYTDKFLKKLVKKNNGK